ncbi:MAG: nitrite reductase, partial [Gammaproteobacteria bacterium]
MMKKTLLAAALAGLAAAPVMAKHQTEVEKLIHEEIKPGGGYWTQGPAAMTDLEWEEAQRIYFDRCAGCHGTLRKGATGPDLLPEKTRQFGTEALKY